MSLLESTLVFALVLGLGAVTFEMYDLASTKVDQFNQQQIDYVKGLANEKITCPAGQ